MENTVKQTGLLEKTGVFDEELKNRYELHLTYNGRLPVINRRKVGMTSNHHALYCGST